MSRSKRWISFVLCLFLVSGFGCDKTAKLAGNSAEEGGALEGGRSAPGGGKSVIPMKREVKSFEGNWVVLITVQARDHFVWIIRLKSTADGKWSGEFVSSAKDDSQPTLEEVAVEDQTVRFVAKTSEASMNFEGTLSGSAIRGTLESPAGDVVPARLISTDATNLKDYAETQLPPGADVFEKAIQSMKQGPQPREIVRIAREHRISPVALDALYSLVVMQSQPQAQFRFSDEELQEVVEEYQECAKVWGPRMLSKVELQCGEQLVTAGRLPQVAIKLLSEAEQRVGDSVAVDKSRLRAYREAAEIQVALIKSRSEAEADRAAAQVELEKALVLQPFNSSVLLALAVRAEATQQIDDAIRYYSDIVALPLLEQFILSQRAGQPPGDPTPTESLKKVWIAKHGSEENLASHLADLHRSKLDAYVEEIRAKAPATPAADVSDHVVLAELFTGGQCVPCVAADVATTALARAFPTTELITLRYHQHIPGPDGLVTQDGEDRFAYYEAAGTPTLAIDGLVLNSSQLPIAGPLQFAGSSYATLRQIVDARRRQSNPIRLQLDARVADGELSIQASATGFTEEELPSLRLRLALVEEAVHAPMPNGIRHHEMLVREMPGGARGLAAKKGELKFSYTMPYSDLQKHLDEYIRRFEAGNKFEFPAEMKPKVEGRLFLVGWVQNDKLTPFNDKLEITTEQENQSNVAKFVLQSSIVPVTGEIPLEGGKAAPTSAPSQSQRGGADSQTRPPEPALPE